MTLVPWWCLFLHVVGLHGHIYRHDRSWNGYGFHTYPHPAKKPVIPRDVMVDVVNDLGLKLLAIHNEYNENNIAISPYGALSVLVALGEGLEGDAVYEIHQATHIPNDISLIRVGLRDIHRHLKSYFIPKEGFLAGLTLNHENVTLRHEYEDILRFYGYDTATFNNALYPQPETEKTTTKEPESTTEMGRTDEMDMTTQIIATTTTPFSETSTTMVPTTVLLETSTTAVPTTILPETSTNVPPTTTNIVITEITTSTPEESTTITVPQTTETAHGTTTTSTATEKLDESTTEKISTTESPTTETTTVAGSSHGTTTVIGSTQPITTTEVISTTTQMTTVTTTVPPPFTSVALEAGTGTESTTHESTELPTNLPSTATTQSSTSSIPETTDGTTVSTMSTTLVETTTNSDETSTNLNGETTTDDNSTPFISDIASTSTSPSVSTDIVTSLSTDITTVNTTPIGTDITEKDNKDNEIDSTDSSVDVEGFGGNTKRKVRSRSVKPSESNVIKLNMKEALLNTNDDLGYRRNSRSVVDYVIARFYDDQFNFHNNPRSYIPEDDPSFLVHGKYREYNIHFMKYDTVLPFHYEPHLNALALSFPLDSTKYYLLLLLPVDENGIDKLICDLRLNGSIKYIIANLRYTHVIATIPSFKLKGYVTLTPSFQKLGIRKVFEPRQADFAPMTNQRGIYVTNIEQAITVTIRNYVDPNLIQNHRNLDRYDPVHFKADHPFLYFVIDSDIHVTLMAGKIVNPLNSRIS